MNKKQIEYYLQLVGEELESKGVVGKILILGGTVMVFRVGVRNDTLDVDVAYGENAKETREAVENVAKREGLPLDWLNDAARVFIYSKPEPVFLKQYAGLETYTPTLDYILAMKIMANREKDIRDARALIAHLGLISSQEILDILKKYIPENLLAPKIEYIALTFFDGE